MNNSFEIHNKGRSFEDVNGQNEPAFDAMNSNNTALHEEQSVTNADSFQRLHSDVDSRKKQFEEIMFSENTTLINDQLMMSAGFPQMLIGNVGGEKSQLDSFSGGAKTDRLLVTEEVSTAELTRDIAGTLRGSMAIGHKMTFTVHIPQLGLIYVNAINSQSVFLVNINASSRSLKKLLKSREKHMSQELENRMRKRSKVRVMGYE